jgi:hypothetical protein
MSSPSLITVNIIYAPSCVLLQVFTPLPLELLLPPSLAGPTYTGSASDLQSGYDEHWLTL